LNHLYFHPDRCNQLLFREVLKLSPQNVFFRVKSHSSISFESDSQSERIESATFAGAWIRSILLLPQVAFIAGDTFPADCRISLSDDFCPQFHASISLREQGSIRDFDCTQNIESAPRTASECVIDRPSFLTIGTVNDTPRVPVQFLTNRATRCQADVKATQCFLPMSKKFSGARSVRL
jgi:hypothetical protein